MRVLCIYCTTADGGDGGTFVTSRAALSELSLLHGVEFAVQLG